MCGCAEAMLRAVVAFFDAVLVDCFLSWFRRRGPASAHRDLLVPKDRGGEALPASDEEKGFAESTGSNEGLVAGGDDIDDEEKGFAESTGSNEGLAAGGDDIDNEELRRVADYLKLYGTISQTPAELQNVSYESNSESSNECDDVSVNALAMGGASESGFNSSEGFKSGEDLRTELEVPPIESLDSVTLSVLRNKSPLWSIKNRLSDCNSPFPTPLVVRDDMQTPGTIYTSRTGSSMSRKRVRTRKQFVYPVLRPKNNLQQMELLEDSSPLLPSSTPKHVHLGADDIKKPEQTSSTSVAKVGFSKSLPFNYPSENASYQEKESPSSEESKCQISPNPLDGEALSKCNSDEKRGALSLTHWLKPSSTDDENQGVVSSYASDQVHDENRLFTESPVFKAAPGMNTDVENPTPRLAKGWDGNGIPNTTTKYKEDQKVSWHATPFEERLLRVLSDEQTNAPRKLVRGDLFHVEELDGGEES